MSLSRADLDERCSGLLDAVTAPARLAAKPDSRCPLAHPQPASIIAALLPQRPQVQLALEHQPQQLPAPRPELVLQLRMRQGRRLRAGQLLLGLLIALPGLRKRLRRLWCVP